MLLAATPENTNGTRLLAVVRWFAVKVAVLSERGYVSRILRKQATLIILLITLLAATTENNNVTRPLTVVRCLAVKVAVTTETCYGTER